MAKRLKIIIEALLSNIFVFGFGLVLVVISCLFLLYGRGAVNSLLEQTLHREQVIVRAGAGSIRSFLQLAGTSLTVLAQQPDQASLNDFVDAWKDTPISGIIFLGKTGIVKYIANPQRVGETGEDLSDRDYFVWAKTAKVGEVKAFTPDKYIVSLASPLYDKAGNFKGVLTVAIVLQQLTDNYLEPLKISEKSRVYLIDRDGVIISSDFEDFAGVNYPEWLEKRQFLGSKITSAAIKKILDSDKEGKLDIALPDPQNNNDLTRFLIAYTPVIVGDQHWTLILATPVTDALVFMQPFYTRQVAMAGVLCLAFVIFAIRISKIYGYSEAVKAEHRAHGLDKYKKSDKMYL